MRLTINVLQQDIEGGVATNCFRCPIALALSRALDQVPFEHYRVAVTASVASIALNGITPSLYQWSSDLPPIAQRFVEYFDDHGGELSYPTEFELEFKPVPFDSQ